MIEKTLPSEFFRSFHQFKTQAALLMLDENDKTGTFVAEFVGSHLDDLDLLKESVSQYLHTNFPLNAWIVQIVRNDWLPRSNGNIDRNASMGKIEALKEAQKSTSLVNGTFSDNLLENEKDCFLNFGSYSKIRTPVEISYPGRVKIGNWVSLGRYGKMVVLPTESFTNLPAYAQQHYPESASDLEKYSLKTIRNPEIKIGDGTSLGDQYFIICTKRVEFGRHIMASARLFITDCQHYFEGTELPPILLPVTEGKPVKIEDHVWIGINCSILDGVTVGKHSVIATNSVVKHDVPPYSLVAGSPAQIKRQFAPH